MSQGLTVNIPRSEFETVCAVPGITVEELCAVYRCHPDTLRSRCHEWYDMTCAEYLISRQNTGRVALRRKGLQMALKGDKTMLKHYLNNYCGMADKVDTTVTTPIGRPIEKVNMTAEEAAQRYAEICKGNG